MKYRMLPYLSGVLFATIFGFSFMFSKIVLQYVTPIQLIAYRFLIAFIVFEMMRLLKVVDIDLRGKRIKLLGMTAIFQPILYFLFETIGLTFTQSNEAGMMIALIPIFVTIFSSLFLKERPTVLQIFFILLSVSGVLYINLVKQSQGIEVSVKGLMLLLGAVLCAAAFNIFSRRASKEFNSYEVTYSMMLSGVVVFNIIAFIQMIIVRDSSFYLSSLFSLELLLPLLYLGIVASIGGFFLVNYSLSKLEAHVSSIFANLATIVSIIAGTVFLKESLYYFHVIGSALIIIGVYGTVKFSRREN